MMTNSKKRLIAPESSGDVFSPDSAPAAAGQQTGVMARATLVVLLSLTLVGTMRWALNITNANARQISTNLTQLQGQYDQQAAKQAAPATRRTEGIVPDRPDLGPLIEPGR